MTTAKMFCSQDSTLTFLSRAVPEDQIDNHSIYYLFFQRKPLSDPYFSHSIRFSLTSFMSKYFLSVRLSLFALYSLIESSQTETSTCTICDGNSKGVIFAMRAPVRGMNLSSALSLQLASTHCWHSYGLGGTED